MFELPLLCAENIFRLIKPTSDCGLLFPFKPFNSFFVSLDAVEFTKYYYPNKNLFVFYDIYYFVAFSVAPNSLTFKKDCLFFIPLFDFEMGAWNSVMLTHSKIRFNNYINEMNLFSSFDFHQSVVELLLFYYLKKNDFNFGEKFVIKKITSSDRDGKIVELLLVATVTKQFLNFKIKDLVDDYDFCCCFKSHNIKPCEFNKLLKFIKFRVKKNPQLIIDDVFTRESYICQLVQPGLIYPRILIFSKKELLDNNYALKFNFSSDTRLKFIFDFARFLIGKF